MFIENPLQERVFASSVRPQSYFRCPLGAAGRRPAGVNPHTAEPQEEQVQVHESQSSLPVFVHPDEHDVTLQAALRKKAFLEQELRLIPHWHQMHHEYREQLGALLRRLDPGPRSVIG